MVEAYSIGEVIQLGIGVEENGKKFYLAAAAKTSNEKAKEMYGILANAEEDHIKQFKKLLSKAGGFDSQGSYTVEFFKYLKLLSGEHIFNKDNKVEDVVKKANSDIEILDFAIGLEKDSMLLYQEMKTLVIEDINSVLDEMIKQEKEHYLKLSILRDALAGA